jgi:hypothetical protein
MYSYCFRRNGKDVSDILAVFMFVTAIRPIYTRYHAPQNKMYIGTEPPLDLRIT